MRDIRKPNKTKETNRFNTPKIQGANSIMLNKDTHELWPLYMYSLLDE